LLLHCLWNEIEQIPIIEQMVSSALDECISNYLCGERTLEQKLSSIREDMKSEHSLRETKDTALQIVDTFYHQIERYPVAVNLLIFASDYQSLQKDT
ncbi:ATPase, partial [Bacteroides fragilis]|nr:ATPase [Bacteroides fragilis]